jgi:hypothetical protein
MVVNGAPVDEAAKYDVITDAGAWSPGSSLL